MLLTLSLRSAIRRAPVAIVLGAATLLTSAPLGAAPTAGRAGAQLLGASASGVRFRLDVAAPVFETLDSDREVSRLEIAGFDAIAPGGEPALPARVVMVAVPPLGEVGVTASGSAPESFENVRVAGLIPEESSDDPRPGAAQRDRTVPRLVAVRPLRAPSVGAEVRARVLGVSWMRNQRVAQIEVRPVAYDWDARRVTVFKQIEVEVRVAPAREQGAPAEDPDPFEDVYRATLVNYEQGRAWRRPRAPSAFDRARIPMAELAGAITVPDSSVFAGRDWVKIAIKKTGFYKVSFDLLFNLGPFAGSRTTPVDSVRMFTLPGLPILPEEGYCDSCEYREVALQVVDDGDGILDDNDRDVLYFFALGPSDWADLYDPAQPDTTFIDHPYATENFYYIGVGAADLPFGGAPRRMSTEDGSPANPTGDEVTPTTFQSREHFEFDAEYWPDPYPHSFFQRATIPWEKWFWKSIGRGNTFPITMDMPGLDASSQPPRLRLRVWGLTFNSFHSANIFDHYLDVQFNTMALPRRAWYFRTQQTFDTLLTDVQETGNTFSVSVPLIRDPNPLYEASRVDQSGLAWVDLFYQRRFTPVANALEFESSPTGGHYIYSIEPFTLPPGTRPRVFDVTDPLAPIEILGAAYDEVPPGSGEYRLRFSRLETGKHRYQVLPETAISRPANTDVFTAPRSSRTNLRSATQGADYLAIYYDGFRAATDSLLRWRRERLPLAGRSAPFDTASVPVSALYDQFSGGRTDPGAIRAFLRAVYFNWGRRPAFVTLIGDASYDFKNIQGYALPGQPAALMPSYESGFDFVLQRQFATDDWIMNVTDDTADRRLGIPDFFAGRIPAGDAASALSYVRDKLLPYERHAPLGEWHNRVMLIADDNEQGSRPDGLGWTHLCQTSSLDTDHIPSETDRLYVYLHTYPDIGDNKPAARDAVLKFVNDGVAMFNYIGHGSAFKIADENTFLESDVPSLKNLTRPALFVAASCDVGKFHDPQFAGIGEKLVMSSVGGCVGVISATEEAFSNQNVALNNVIYDQIFSRDPASGRYYVGPAEALLAAKVQTTPPGQSVPNNAKYQLLGDAGVTLALPRLYTEVLLQDANGQPVTQAARGQTVSFKGRVLDRPGGSAVPFTGNAQLLIEDSAPLGLVSGGGLTCTYPFRAAPMFRGDVGIVGGQFQGRFIVPLDAVAGARARIRAYVEGVAASDPFESDGVGSAAYDLVAGGDPGGDTEGPTVKLSFEGGSTSVRPGAVLKIELFDPSGILITGHNLQNAIVVTRDDDVTTRVDVSPSFRYAANSYQSGIATFTLPTLTPGPHTIKVSAADNLASGINASQHRSSATIAFEITDNPPLTVTRAFLFPNPAVSGGLHSGGRFVVDAPGDPVNVLLRIYTISGRLIRTLRAMGGQGQIQIAWDGLDDEGYPLAIGTYLFHVHANPRDSQGESSARLKAVADGRFVIVGHEP